MLKKIYNFYLDGFKNLTIGKTLWKIIIIKLFILFGIFKIFIYEKKSFSTDEQQSEFVYKNMTKGE